ncbi:NADH-quinone oxidoreductase subunit NuoF [Zhaonella formicivorans]|uniref:NADH-quinone oxidoreductase subunit NuoF n=1 Tax=Zhaonella formicivorans TaxID=2528593 RepID=UPI001D12468E|nr:NADH-quinone oxidoreductase subunit NuoF [Zhaonella formicivorans]
MSNKRILVCGGTGCISSKSRSTYDVLEEELRRHDELAEYQLAFTGCHGFCEQGPVIIIEPEGTFYAQVTPDKAKEVVTGLLKGEAVEGLLYVDPVSGCRVLRRDEIPFYQKQQRLVLKNCGLIDPEDIKDYLARDGYKALTLALQMDGQHIVDWVKQSGLRGRGGGGFPTGIKWESTRNAVGDKKYVICNADEGDPGAFMDRSLLEGDPHAVLEGMIIAGYATGAREGFIYIRAEYPLAVKRLAVAIEQAEKEGFLGENILGSGFSFTIRLKHGAGAFVCGEETALINSIQGNRGMPRPRPPFPAVKGLWDRPTLINNVETFANIPVIFSLGPHKYSQIGTEQSKGTKIFALTGKINNTGLVEVPMGITLREIIFDIAGGIRGGKEFKAVQIGGPSGGCLTEEHLDLPVDYDSLISAGAMMGSGGLVVMDESTCMVDLARFFLTFTRTESCGKCTPCREGTKRLLEILERITGGNGREGDIELLESLGRNVIDTSLCGLGQSAPNPILSTIRYFRKEYELHVKHKVCPAGVCKALTSYRVLAEKCKACGICKKHCPAGAITGEKKVAHVIDPEKCAKCGICFEKCPFGAIMK